MPQIEVRPAREEDRAAVLAFCASTWEWGDYIEYVWDEWLSDPAGQLLVATVDGQPAAIAHLEMVTNTDAWLEGLRVDPNHRRQGLARALNEGLLLEAMRRGATEARLAVESTNTRSIQITENSHWHRIGAFALYSATPLAAPQRRPVQERTLLATADDLEDIVNYLNVSNVMPAVGGIYYLRFKAYPITTELLREKIEAQSVYLLRRWDRLDGLAIAEPREEHQGKRLSLGYIDGTAIEAISLIAYDLRRRAAELSMQEIRAFAPDLVLVRDAFSGVEYEWDEAVYYTYQRGLT